MSIVTHTETYRGEVRTTHHDRLSCLLLSCARGGLGFREDAAIHFHAAHFTDPRACADEIAAVIAKYRRADKPAEAV